MPTNKNRFLDFKEELQQKVDFIGLYANLGCDALSSPDSRGWVACRSHPAFGGQDKSPSAQFNAISGVYVDFRGGGRSMTVWDFMAATGQAANWRDAQKDVAERYGIKMMNISKNHPANGVEWLDWDSRASAVFCKKKPPVSEKGLLQSGASLCKRFGVYCFAWEVFDENMYVIGYYFMRCNGEPFESAAAAGAKGIPKRYANMQGGLAGRPGVSTMVSGSPLPCVYWMEGVPDMIAAYSVYPEANNFIANVNGALETLRDNQIATLKLTRANIILVADCDEPGIAGANKRHESIKKELGDTEGSIEDREVDIYRPSGYEIIKKGGKDLRDWLGDNYDTATADKDSMQLASHLTKCGIQAAKKLSVDRDHQALQYIMQSNDKVLGSLSLEAMSTSSDGSILIDCAATNRRRLFTKISDFTFIEGIALAGTRFQQKVAATKEDAESSGKIFMGELVSSVAEHVSRTENIVTTAVGNGIWRIGPSNDIYIVKSGRFFRYDDGKIVPAARNCVHKHVTDTVGSKDWVDFGLLETYLRQARETEWRISVHEELDSYVSSWNWRHPSMAMLACGLMYSTWIQSMWNWRPNILLVGESNSGKSEFLHMMSRIFLNVNPPSGGSSAAGVLQNVGYDSTPMLIDEFDTASEQIKILQMLRNSGRGTRILRGTPGQKKREYHLCHIPWLSGIHMSSDAQADKNRMIELDLKMADDYSLNIAGRSECNELGYKILASVITTTTDALRLAAEIQDINIKKGGYTRYHESYNIPYAALGAMIGGEPDVMAELMREYFTEYLNVQIATDDVRNDQEALLYDIMSAKIRLPHGSASTEATVAQILTDMKYVEHFDELPVRGITLREMKDNRKWLIIHPKSLTGATGLLGTSPSWAGNKGLMKVLERLTSLEPEKSLMSMAGTTKWCIKFPWVAIRRWMENRKRDTLFDK